MDAVESRDAYEIFTERHRAGSMIVTSNRGPDEWLGTFADPMRAQSAIDRFHGNSYDLLIEGESYRTRQKPQLGDTQPARGTTGHRSGRRRRNGQPAPAGRPVASSSATEVRTQTAAIPATTRATKATTA
jgi:hypothetical protein